MLAYRIPRGANYTSTTRDYYCKHRRTKLSSHALCRQGWREFPSAPVMLKENRHCLNDSEQPFKHWKKGKRCLSGVFSVAVNAWRASPFAPNAWTISCEWQTTLDRVLTTWHEQKSVVTHFVCAGRFWYFLTRQKVHERKTWRKIQVKA